MRLERETHIAAPPERVYEVVMDPKRLGDWVTIHQRLEEAPDGPLRQGSTLTQRLRLAHRNFTVHWEVVENEACRRVVWEGKGPVRSRARVEYGFAADNGGTRFTYTNEYHLPGGPLGNLAGPALRRVTGREIDGTLARLKALFE
jgi:carbon monoxide dehydrogenase subunit G